MQFRWAHILTLTHIHSWIKKERERRKENDLLCLLQAGWLEDVLSISECILWCNLYPGTGEQHTKDAHSYFYFYFLLCHSIACARDTDSQCECQWDRKRRRRRERERERENALINTMTRLTTDINWPSREQEWVIQGEWKTHTSVIIDSWSKVRVLRVIEKHKATRGAITRDGHLKQWRGGQRERERDRHSQLKWRHRWCHWLCEVTWLPTAHYT